MIKFLKENLLRILLLIGFVVGGQAPNFINQYFQRISAHLIEAEKNFAGFQKTADEFFGGEIKELIEKHRLSKDSVFKSETQSIQNIYERIENFRKEILVRDKNLISKVFHVLVFSDKDVLQETIDEYIPNVPLNSESLLSGVVFAFSLVFLTQFIFKFFKR
jgi:hypothetical protein